MTGFGRGTAVGVTGRVAIEVRSVNHRFLDLKLRGAPSAAIEELCAARIRERLERGAVTVSIRVDRGASAEVAQIDAAAARQAHAALAALAAALGLAAPTLADVVAVPGVLIAPGGADADDGDLLDTAGRALAAALDELRAHRAAEGRALVADLTARVATVRALVDGVAVAAAEAGSLIAARLRERIERVLERAGDVAATLTPERLAQEVAVLVERADVTEEMVRARTHLDALAATLAGGAATAAAAGTAGAPAAASTAKPGPTSTSIGRRLDFLLQELGREINTTGAKSATAAISSQVVQAKAELEKMREQVQNLE